jgi:hypothetical protein
MPPHSEKQSFRIKSESHRGMLPTRVI